MYGVYKEIMNINIGSSNASRTSSRKDSNAGPDGSLRLITISPL